MYTVSADPADSLSVAALLRTLYARSLLVGTCLVVGTLAGALAAWYLPSYFRAQMTLAPAADLASASGPGGLGSLASQFGGVASLAGINLGASGTDRSTVTLETLRGQGFLVDFARRRGLVVPLFAARGVDPASGEILINGRVYDAATQQWHRSMLFNTRPEPTDSEVFRKMSRFFKVAQDRKTGIVTLTVDSRSPRYAFDWATMLVADLNDFLRQRDSEEAKITLRYLDKQIAETQVQDMRQIFYKLVEEQTKTLMLAQVRKEYALKVIDPALVPDRPVWPGKVATVAIGALGGLSLGLLLAMLFPRRSGSPTAIPRPR